MRWGLFPSFSAGWNIAREDFFRPLAGVIGTLKLRGSWGQLGNNNTDKANAWYPFYQNMITGSANSGWLIDSKKQNTAQLPGIVNSLCLGNHLNHGTLVWISVYSITV